MTNEVKVETVNVSMVGLSLIIMDGQVAESERYIALLQRRRSRLLAELSELDDQIHDAVKRRDQDQAKINATLDAARSRNTDIYRL